MYGSAEGRRFPWVWPVTHSSWGGPHAGSHYAVTPEPALEQAEGVSVHYIHRLAPLYDIID